MGHTSSGVVTLTYSILCPGCVGAMNLFLTDSTQKSSGVGTLLVPMIKAVLSGGGTSEDDADAVDTGTTVAVTTSTATPIDTAIRVATAKAPTRPTHLR